MTQAHRRKKNPDLVRLQLIESARRLAFEHGLAGVSVEAVATEAGVTKGALFHHFVNKQALGDAVFQHMLDEFQAALEARLHADPEPHGRFTRAWVELAFEEVDSQWGPLWMASLTDPKLRSAWGAWFNQQLGRHDETGPLMEAVRFAADGIWLGKLFGVMPADRDRLRRHLIELTKSRA